RRVIALGFLVALVVQTGVRSPGLVRRELLVRLGGGQAAALRSLGVTVVTGNYWSAWPTVFAMNMMHEVESGTRPVLAIALRAEVLRDRWDLALAADPLIAIVPPGDLEFW